MASLRLQAVLLGLGLALALGLGLAPTVAASIPDTQGIADDFLSRLSEPRPELDVSEPVRVAGDAPSLPETRVRGFRLFDPLSRPGYNGVSRGNATGSTFGLWGNRVGPVQKGLWTDPVTGAAYARARWYDARNGVFLTEDPMDDIDSPNMYAFVGWAPSMYTDPEGEALETLWDAASLGLGLVSLHHNLKEGNYGMATLDAFGVAVDGLATAVPFVPGGVGAGLKASRAAGWLGKAQYVDQASNVAQGTLQAAVSYEEGDTGWAAFYGGMSAVGMRGMAKSPFKVEAHGIGSTGGNVKIVPKAVDDASASSPAGIRSWNDFQAATAGRFDSRARAATGWKVYKEANRADKTLVIGTLDDTRRFEALGYQRLNTGNWSPTVNDAWVQGGIDASKRFKLVSPVIRENLVRPPGSRYPTTVFYRELKQLKEAGYAIRDGWAMPPGAR